MNEILQAALAYREAGFSVIPILQRGKKPAWRLLPENTTGRQGWECFQKAPPTTQEIEGWFYEKPRLNIGIVTGEVSGILVLDIDTQEGIDVLKRRVSERELRTPWVKTAHGWHGYFQYPRGKAIANRVRFLPGLDIRAEGGYIVAPPSMHISGHVYGWKRGIIPHRDGMAAFPRSLLALVVKKEVLKVRSEREVLFNNTFTDEALRIWDEKIRDLRNAGEHHRNTQLNLSAYMLARLCGAGAFRESQARDTLYSEAIALGLSPSEIERTLNSAFKAGLPRKWIFYARDGGGK